jgi:integrase
MASPRNIGTKAKPRWQARWRDPDGKQRAKVFARKIDADNMVASMEHNKLQGTYVDPRAGRIAFRSYAEKWLVNQVQHRDTTRDQVRRLVTKHMIDVFGDRTLDSIVRSDITAWVTERTATLAPVTVVTAYRYLAAIFRSAVADRKLAQSPCQQIELPKVEKIPVVPLTVEQVEAIANRMPPRYRALLLVGATTGLRFGELIGVTLDRVDFLRKTLRVDRQWRDRYNNFGPPKYPASYRTIPLAEATIGILAAHLAEFPALDREGGFVFHEGTRPIRRNAFSVIWHEAADKVRRDVTPHDLRHFYASVLIAKGADVKLVQARMGHESAQTTLDDYGHLWPDSDERTRTAIDAAFDKVLTTGRSGAANGVGAAKDAGQSLP